MRSLAVLFAGFILLAAQISSPLRAQVISNGLSKVVSVELLDGWQLSSGNYMAALRFRLAPGWKTYWRAPGGNGIPPAFDWRGSANLKGVKVNWPAPQVFIQNGVRTIGYKKELILPLEISPKDKGKTIRAALTVDFGVCEDICVPAQVTLNKSLGQGVAGHKTLIKQAMAARAISAKKAGIKAVSCQAEPTGKGVRLTVRMRKKTAFAKATYVVFEVPDKNVWVKPVSVQVKGQELQASAELVRFGGGMFLDRSKISMTLLSKGKAVEINGCPAG